MTSRARKEELEACRSVWRIFIETESGKREIGKHARHMGLEPEPIMIDADLEAEGCVHVG